MAPFSNPRSSIFYPRLIAGGAFLFLYEFIGRDFGVDLDLADLPLFVGRAAFDLGNAVRQVEAPDVLVIAERPSVIDIRGFLESLLSFFSEAFALFRSKFRALSRLSSLSRLSGLRALRSLSALTTVLASGSALTTTGASTGSTRHSGAA